MAEGGGGAVARMHAVLARYDAGAEAGPPDGRLLVFDRAPKDGDTVLVVDEEGPRLARYRRGMRTNPAWIVAVVKAAVGVLVLTAC